MGHYIVLVVGKAQAVEVDRKAAQQVAEKVAAVVQDKLVVGLDKPVALGTHYQILLVKSE